MILIRSAILSRFLPHPAMRPELPDQPANLAKRLAHSGLRNTPQREVVYQALLARRDHPTADEVYSRVRPEMPSISLATVYNCLETLVQCDLVRQVNFERGPSRYCANLHPHAHFHDEKTGATYDISLPPEVIAHVRSVLPSGYDAKTVEITFHGQSPAA
jgi:Fur family transcriptional regulator, peroxide stress response regulator